MFSGAITALVTPMRDGRVDPSGLRSLVELQISEGIDGLVPCGSTGEAATLSPDEQSLVFRTVVEQTRQRVPVIAGCSSNNTTTAVANSRMAREAGVDGLLHATPYYNKPTPAGLVAHYRAVTGATDLPVLLYNVPGRTGCDLLPETVVELARLPHVVGIKEASGSVARGQQIIASCPEGFCVLSGDDAIALALVALGGHGVISVVSNLAPGQVQQMIKDAREGRLEEARAAHYRLLPLMDLLFIESNPIPVKAAVSLMGHSGNEVRLPLLPLHEEKLARVQAEMRRQGLCR